jgi:hypothetical protein
LIFGRYLRYDDADKAIFSVLPEFMKQFNDGLNRIYDAKNADPTNDQINKFITYLSFYFPNIKHPQPTGTPPTGTGTPPTGTGTPPTGTGTPPTGTGPKPIIGGYQQPSQYNLPPRYNPPPYQRYNPPRYNPYGTQPYLVKNMVRRDNEYDNSKLAYYITIDMELHPGTSITPQEQKVLKCRQKWNSIRKAYADFVGKPYIIPPVYQTKTIKSREDIKNKTQNKKPNPQNNTRKYNPNQRFVKGGVRTVKNR